MKQYIYIFITVFLVQACQSQPQEELLSIIINSPSEKWNGRNEQDYIKLWLNDSLVFSGTYYTQFNDTLSDSFVPRVKDRWGMTVASLNKKTMKYCDTLKVRLRLVTLDGMPNERPICVDSTFFFHPIDSIFDIMFLVDKVNRNEKTFRGYDYYHNPERWEWD